MLGLLLVLEGGFVGLLEGVELSLVGCVLC